jgi:hypothetical protein
MSGEFMNAGICTLFEGSYCYGAGALINSLIASGFKGKFFAGYRGQQPEWDLNQIAQHGVTVQMVPLSTDYHLTNYKPNFMQDILNEDLDLTHLCYVDPDIVVSCQWNRILEWLTCGVALCEDVNSPVSSNHPRRVGWRRHFAHTSEEMKCRTEVYVNGGFVGVARADMPFLEKWQSLSEEMATVIGGLGVAKLTNGKAFLSKGFADCFSCSDQDALNAAIEFDTARTSILGQDAMAFTFGDIFLPHAVGAGKPWQRRHLLEALRGVSPRLVDRLFLQNFSGPIPVFGATKILRMKLALTLAALITRVWHK